MRVDIVTIFPEFFSVLDVSLLGRARADGVLDIRVHDAVVRLQGSTFAKLMANSTRPLRRRLVALFFETIDVRQHVETMRAQLRNQMAGSADPETIERGLRAYLTERTRPLRERIAKLHPEPRKRRPS